MSAEAGGVLKTEPLRFLLVEDNPIDVELLQRELRRAEFEFTSAVVQTPEDFTREVRAHPPQIVLADYNLPQWRGMEAVEILRSENLDVPVILVSGSLGEVNAVECLRQGATDYVLKGALTRLPVAIRRALAERGLREQRKSADEARELLATVVESSQDAIIRKTLQGTITAWNPAAERMFGYSSSEVLGKSMLLLIPPDRANEEADILARLGRGESVRHFETVRVRKDGKKIDISATISPIRDRHGTIVGISKIARDITERRRAEDALQQSDARRRFALETAKLGDWELDLATMHATRSFLHDEIFGYDSPLPEWSFDTFLGHVHPDDRERVRENFQTCVRQGSRLEFECRIVCLNGELRWIWTCGNHYSEPSGGASRMFGVVADITERKKTANALAERTEELSRQAVELVRSQTALQDQTRMLKLVLESTGEGLVAADLEGHFFIWNDSAKQLLGRDAADISPEQWTSYYQVYLPDGITPYPADRLPLTRALRGESVQEELLIRRPAAGGAVFLEVTARPLKDDQGNLCGGVAAVRDITAQKLANDLFRRAVEASPSGILMVGAAGEILLANAESERLFGYEAGELLGQSVEKLVPGRFRQAHAEQRAAYDAAPVKRRVEDRQELFGLRKNGSEFPVEIGLNPVQTASGTQTLIAVVDITARKEAARAAANYTQDLQRSNAELEQFAYIAAHDLQEPLRMVASYTELLRERYQGKLDDKADKYIGYAVDGAQRMQRLLNDLLAYSRVGTKAKALQATDTEALLSAVLRGLQKAVEASQAVIVREKLPMVLADEVQLGQVLQNLIGNALKFHGERAPRIRVSAEVIEKMVRFAVADNGIGMQKESSGRIFQMFQRLHTRDEYEGSGIGLAIAKKIVERHGGEIWFDSVPGEGTTFYFTIQVVAKEGDREGLCSNAAGAG
jgi:PAS domain S-box-containing protein